MIKEGETITVIVAPLRTGEAGALLKQVTLADGRKFGNGARRARRISNSSTGEYRSCARP